MLKTSIDILRFHDRKFLRENRTEKITKSSIQAFRREWIPLLGPDNFKFNDTPIELETSHTIIGSLVQHPVSFLPESDCISVMEFRQHDFVQVEDRKSTMNG